MPFTRNRHYLAGTLERLRVQSGPNPWREPVCAGIAHLFSHGAQFDHCISDSPFSRHFFEAVREVSPDTDDSLCFMLFEDLAIFFREKVLRHVVFSAKQADISACGQALCPGSSLASPEARVLALFESCDEWAPGSANQASAWYWSTVPRLVVDSASARPLHPVNAELI